MTHILESHTGRVPVWVVVKDNGDRVGPFYSNMEAQACLERIQKECRHPECSCERPDECA